MNFCVALDDIAFWLSMDLQPHKTLVNESWIPNFPVYRAQYIYKDIRLITQTPQTPDILKQLKVAHELHKIRKYWN